MEIMKENADGCEKLKKNEFFALMVTDLENRGRRNHKDYIDYFRGYLGLERTSQEEIYISRDFYKRENLSKGIVVIVKVNKKDKVCDLTN